MICGLFVDLPESSFVDLVLPPAGFILDVHCFSLCGKSIYQVTVDGDSEKQISFYSYPHACPRVLQRSGCLRTQTLISGRDSRKIERLFNYSREMRSGTIQRVTKSIHNFADFTNLNGSILFAAAVGEKVGRGGWGKWGGRETATREQ